MAKLLSVLAEENEGGKSTHGAGEEEEHRKLTDHIGNEGLARLGMPGEGDTAIGNEVIEKVVKNKANGAYNKLAQRKLY